MLDSTIEILLILLLIFTPLAFGSQVPWAYFLMELGILLIIILWAAQRLSHRLSANRYENKSAIANAKVDMSSRTSSNSDNGSARRSNELRITSNDSRTTSNYSRITNNYLLITVLLLSLFLGFVFFQMVSLPEGIVKIISPKTFDLRSELSVVHPVTSSQSPITNNQSLMTTLSFYPFATKVEVLKWISLSGLFIFLLQWRLTDNRYRVTKHLIIVIFLVGVFESLYGMFEFFSDRRHIFNLDWSAWISSVTGTFLNRNCFAGYLLMVIPLSIGFLYSREVNQSKHYMGWRHRLSSLDGKNFLLGFGVILMILGLLLSASRGGIVSLLISFSLVVFLFRNPHQSRRFSKTSVLIFGLAVLWLVLIGLDAVISRFFHTPEGLSSRWILWENTAEILKDFPILGSGLGTFTEVFSMYRSSHILALDIQAENDFLQLASEVGAVGILPLIGLFILLFSKAVSGIRSLSPGDPRRYIAVGGLVGILGLMFHSIVQKNLQLPANAFLYTVLWAIVLRIGLGPEPKRSRRDPRN